MVTNNRLIRQKLDKKTFALLLIFPLALFVQTIVLPRLPNKYFYDSYHILAVFMGKQSDTGSWLFSANFFHAIDLFHFTTLTQWSYLLAFIFNILLFFILMRYQNYKFYDYLFIYCVAGLLNIYVFRMSKEIIQYIFFLSVCYIAHSKLSYKFKLSLIVLLLIGEGLSFRNYYLLIAVLFVIVSYIMNLENKYSTTHKILLLFLLCVFGMLVLRLLSYDAFMTIINIRDFLTIPRQGKEDANTLILNLINQNSSPLLFIVNYFINFFRIMFPVELLAKGLFYWPFVLFQLFVSLRLIAVLSKKGSENQSFLEERKKIILSMIIAFYLVSAIFEPDFGSFIRHESAFSPMLFDLYFDVQTPKKPVKKMIDPIRNTWAAR